MEGREGWKEQKRKRSLVPLVSSLWASDAWGTLSLFQLACYLKSYKNFQYTVTTFHTHISSLMYVNA